MSTSRQTDKSLFDCTIEGDLAHVHLHNGMFLLGGDLEERDRLFSVFEELDKSKKVKAVLVFNDADALTANAHRQYFDQILGERDSGLSENSMQMIHRENNALGQYSLLAARSSKVLVSCQLGEIASPFFALGLMSDIRLAAPATSFRLSHVELGIPPNAGLSFLLPRFVGRGRSTSWLLAGGRIDVETAYRLGLITAVMDQEAFVQNCIDWVGNTLVSGTDHIRSTRQLIYRDCESIFSELVKEETVVTLSALSKKDT